MESASYTNINSYHLILIRSSRRNVIISFHSDTDKTITVIGALETSFCISPCLRQAISINVICANMKTAEFALISSARQLRGSSHAERPLIRTDIITLYLNAICSQTILFTDIIKLEYSRDKMKCFVFLPSCNTFNQRLNSARIRGVTCRLVCLARLSK